MCASSPRPSVRLTCLALVLVAGAATAAAQDRQGDRGIALVRPALNALYPDLGGKYIEMTFHTLMAPTWDMNFRLGVEFTVWDREPGTEESSGSPDVHGNIQETVKRPKALLTGFVGFDQHGRLRAIETHDSELLSSQKRKALVALCHEHSEWSETRALQALKDAGARYAPSEGEALRQRLPFRQLEPFLGKLTLKSLRFESTQTSAVNCGEIYWLAVATAEPRGPGQPSIEYTLHFEPFGGRLTGFLADPFQVIP